MERGRAAHTCTRVCACVSVCDCARVYACVRVGAAPVYAQRTAACTSKSTYKGQLTRTRVTGLIFSAMGGVCVRPGRVLAGACTLELSGPENLNAHFLDFTLRREIS